MKTFLMLVVLLQCTTSKVIVRDDQYIGHFGKMYQKMKDDAGIEWQHPVNPKKMELLLNDHVPFTNSCVEERKFDRMEIPKNNVTFEEIAKKAGFNHVHRESLATRPNCQFDYTVFSRGNYSTRLSGELCVMEMITGGAAAGDYDNDGLQDIFFTIYTGRSLLYRNNGDGTFTDVTVSTNVGPAMYGSGAGWIDVDADGDLDLFVTTVGDTRYYLYINNGGHFSEEAVRRGVSMQFPNNRKLAGYTPNFGDFDQDGYLDIYVSEWIFHSTSGEVSAARLLRNLGNKKPGYFEDVTDKAGVNMDGLWKMFRNKHGSGTHTFGASFTDFDNDGWPELLVTGDFGQSKMFWNNKNGTFTECTRKCGITGGEDAMGHAIGDINNDGHMDIFFSAIYYTKKTCRLYSCAVGTIGNSLYQYKTNRNFTDIAEKVGVSNSGWGWGASFLDFDNDGYLDLVCTNGFDSPSTTLDDVYGKDNVYLFHNQGEGMSNKMSNVALERGIKFHGLGRGLLIFDFDNDGDQDIVVAANVGPAQFFKNNGGNRKHWLRVWALNKCLGNTNKLCNSYGAKISVTSKNGKTQTLLIGSKTHFLGQSELSAHFGLGTNKDNVTVEVYWPSSKKKVTLQHVAVNQRLKVIEPSSTHETITATELKKCPTLKIKDILVQPIDGKVHINKDGTSAMYDPKTLSLFDAGLQNFKYSVEVSPPSLVNSTIEGIVTLDFRVTPNIYPKCENGYQIINGQEKLQPTVERRLDGVSNNMKNLNWGAVSEDLTRLVPNAYADNISQPASACTATQTLTKKCPFPMELSGIGSSRPSPREISNTLMAQTENHFSKRNLSDFVMHFGQFLVHDIDHSSPLPRFEFQYYHNHVWMPITIPKGDVHFDPYSTGKEKMPFVRSSFNRCTGSYPGKTARNQFNTISSYIDANNVYGVTIKRCSHLREFRNGRMKIASNLLLPKNKAYLANENPNGLPAEELYVAGDIRANVQPGLMSIHALFVREHNRLAYQYRINQPMASDEEVFQKARRLVIAELQSITYKEYLPAILGGSQHIPKYTGYKSNVHAAVSQEFSTAAFRFGHSQVNSFVFRLKKDGKPIKEGHGLLREMYFKPARLEKEGGVDPVFRGAVAFPAQEIDVLMVDEMRNALFTPSGSVGKQSGFDLASLNIQRGRDHGLPDLNTVRKKLGLRAYTKFSEITSNEIISEKLKSLYKGINNIDLWIGGLAEDHVKNSELGETFHYIIVDQFIKLRDGDRFWYQRNLTKEEIKMIESTTMGKIIRLNTGFDECPDNAFFSTQNCIGVKDHQCIPKKKQNKLYELEQKNSNLLEDKDNQKEQINILIAVLAVIGFLCFVTLLIVIRFAILKRKGGSSDKELPSKTVLELDHTNDVADA